jgi:hypothetical protein
LDRCSIDTSGVAEGSVIAVFPLALLLPPMLT